jgi:hypothetical protein
MSENEIKIHSTGQVFIEQGWYTPEYLKTILECIERQNKHIQQAMEPSK